MVIISFLWKLLTNNKLSAIDSFITILRYLLNQSNNKESRSFADRHNKRLALSYITLLVIWLLVSLVLNQSYTSLLLNTYFNVKTTPVVQNLEDIRNNKDLLIVGIPEYLSRVSIDFNFKINDLLERIEKDPDNLPDPFISSKICEKILDGKSVLIGDTEQINTFMEHNKYYHDNLVVVDKYLPEFISFYVSKNMPLANVVHY